MSAWHAPCCKQVRLIFKGPAQCIFRMNTHVQFEHDACRSVGSKGVLNPSTHWHFIDAWPQMYGQTNCWVPPHDSAGNPLYYGIVCMVCVRVCVCESVGGCWRFCIFMLVFVFVRSVCVWFVVCAFARVCVHWHGSRGMPSCVSVSCMFLCISSHTQIGICMCTRTRCMHAQAHAHVASIYGFVCDKSNMVNFLLTVNFEAAAWHFS
jgi:hypothetical protein